jgi:transcriptional repressor NrdR
MNLLVVKRDGRREEYDRLKLYEGLRKACAKRPISTEALNQLVDQVESQLYSMGQGEVSSRVIGELVMAKLKELDAVAYVRFASVYRSFADLEDLKREVDGLISGR